MKKTVLSLLILFMGATMFAQTGADALKQASKQLSKYNKDPFSNAGALSEAKTLLATAFEDDGVKSNAQSWVTRGEIFKGLILLLGKWQ